MYVKSVKAVSRTDGVDEDVLVVDEIDGGNQGLGHSEEHEEKLSGVGRIIETHPNEWGQGDDLKDGTESEAVGHLAQKVEGKSESDDVGTGLGREAEATAVAALVHFLKALNTFVLRNASSDFFHIHRKSSFKL